MVVDELFATLGLDVDAASFAKGMLAVDGVEAGLKFLAHQVERVTHVLADSVTETANYGDEMLKLKQKTGTAADTIQELVHAAGLADVSVEGLQKSLNYLSRNGSKDPGKDFLAAANAIQKLVESGRESEAPAEAIRRLGKSGADLIPMLRGGSAALAEAGQEARAFGLVLGEDALHASEEFNDSITRLHSSLKGAMYSAVVPLLVPLRELIDGVRMWVVANRQLLATRFAQGLKLIGAMLKIVWVLLHPVVSLIAWFVKGSAPARAALFLLGTALAFLSVQLLASTALFSAWGQAALLAGTRAALAPIIAAAPWILLLGLLGLIIEDTYQALTGGKSFFGEWTRFLKSDPSDSPFMSGLKSIGRFLTTLDEKFQSLIDKFSGSALGKWMQSHTEDGADRARRGQLTPTEKANGAFGYNPQKPDALVLPAYRTGTPGVGSSTPAFLRSSGGNFPTTQSPFLARGADTARAGVQVGGITIQISGAQDPEAVGSEVEKRMKSFWNAQVGQAYGGVD